jgi:hypothetical protein
MFQQQQPQVDYEALLEDAKQKGKMLLGFFLVIRVAPWIVDAVYK